MDKKNAYWPLMNADERGFWTAHFSAFYQRLSAFISGPLYE
jgi:hypothetical protein